MEHIIVSKETKDKLDELKIIPRETYGSVVDRVLPKTLEIIKVDGKTINCFLHNFKMVEGEPSLNIFSAEKNTNFIIPMKIIKSIKEVKNGR